MARTTIRTEDITASEVTTAKMAVDPTNASNLSSGSVPTAQLGNVDTAGLEDDIALLGFKVAANGSLAKYNLVDQTIDAFEDASGIDASASSNEARNAAGKFYSCTTPVTTVWSAAVTGNNAGWANYTNRQALQNFSGGGSQVRCDMIGGTSGMTVDHVAIVERDGTTFNGTEVPTELLFSSSSGVVIGSSATVTSDWANFSTTASSNYLHIADFAGTGGNTLAKISGYYGGTDGQAYKASADSYNVQNMPSSPILSANLYGISKVEIRDSATSMTLVSNATTAQDGAPTKGDLVITYTNESGTATIGTDLKAYISRDGSAYTSSITLTAQGTTGGHTILTAHDVDLSGIASGTSMRWKIETLNQELSVKDTRIHAVSLGWS